MKPRKKPRLDGRQGKNAQSEKREKLKETEADPSEEEAVEDEFDIENEDVPEGFPNPQQS